VIEHSASCDKLMPIKPFNSGMVAAEKVRDASNASAAQYLDQSLCQDTWSRKLLNIDNQVSLLRLVRTAIRRRGAASTGTTRFVFTIAMTVRISVEDKWCAGLVLDIMASIKRGLQTEATKSLRHVDHKEHVLDAFELPLSSDQVEVNAGFVRGDMGSRRNHK
jgi:hypothetical protein